MRGRMVPLEVPRPRDRIRVARWWRRAAWLTGAGGLAALVLGVFDVAGKYYLPEVGAFVIYALMIVLLVAFPAGLFGARR